MEAQRHLSNTSPLDRHVFDSAPRDEENLNAYVQDLKKLAKENNSKRMRKKGEPFDHAEDPNAAAQLKEKRKRKAAVAEELALRQAEFEANEAREDELNGARLTNRSSQQPRQSQHGTRNKRSKDNLQLQQQPPAKRSHLLRQSEEVRRGRGDTEALHNSPFERDLSSPPRLLRKSRTWR